MTTKEYTNGDVTIIWQPEKCQHAAECVKNLPQVFHPKEKPWIQSQNASSAEIVETVGKCPSGALTIKSKS
ncbi:hypothetical protein GCM10009007_20310 [Formosimonas limnophila]|uniref:Divergent 4Fe-4S mono-cluster domain-containing protein n=1 Tax=Formosimonas limnophila TaxID=1384487 RepID=A0A8J3CML6_9BURK|nr:(4Fe-4S)-binding protein [Formosimonas limnophila]GHA79204.1 hypothetical protein GCM10009007_20310 [Formosimonas limnophila]